MKELDTLTSADIVHLHGCSGFDRKTRFVSAADVDDLRAQRDSAVAALVALREAANQAAVEMDCAGLDNEALLEAIDGATPNQEYEQLEAEIVGTK